MKRRNPMIAVAALTFVLSGGTGSALGQDVRRGKLEIAVLAGVNVLMADAGYSTTTIGIPAGASTFPVSPAVRLTLWSGSRLNADLGASYLQVNPGPSVLTFEVGVGPSFGERNAPVQPFLTPLVGFLSLSDGGWTQTEFYLGGLAGVRAFIHDYAAARAQFGYRRMLGDKFKFKALEISVGLSVFI